MIIDEHLIVRRIKSPVRGVVHVGAHEAQELPFYRRNFGPDVPVFWIEGDPEVYTRLCDVIEADGHSEAGNYVISDSHDELARFHRANMDQSSSLLELGTHKDVHPEVHYVDTIEVRTTTLDNVVETHDLWKFNFLNMDVQGAEGLVILGASRYLEGVDYIYTEVNRDELYEGCITLPDMDEALSTYGFLRRETLIYDGFGWGDALYVKDGLR